MKRKRLKKATRRKPKPKARKDEHRALRKHLLNLLDARGAHVNFDDAVADFPAELRGAKPPGAPHSAWELLEHMRLAQWDILDFSINPDYQDKEFPAAYWPATPAPLSDDAWNKSLRAFRADLKAMKELVTDPSTDLFARIPHGTGQTILREALLVADHNAYHLGQLVHVRRLLGAWSSD